MTPVSAATCSASVSARRNASSIRACAGKSAIVDFLRRHDLGFRIRRLRLLARRLAVTLGIARRALAALATAAAVVAATVVAAAGQGAEGAAAKEGHRLARRADGDLPQLGDFLGERVAQVVALKAAGAGGGDCGVALAGPGVDAAAIRSAWERAGVRALDLRPTEPTTTGGV